MPLVPSVNRAHPLLRGMMSWWLVRSRTIGGSMLPDVLNQAPAMFASGKPTWDSAIGRVGGKASLRLTGPQWLKATTPEVGTVTIAAWVRTANDALQQEVISNTGDSVLLRLYDSNTFGVSFYVQVGAVYYGATSTPTIGTGWRHLCGTYDGEDVCLYLDGVLVNTNSGPSGPISTFGTNNVLIGIHSGLSQFPYTGVLDDIARWNRALSAAEVQQWYRLSQKRYVGILNLRSRTSIANCSAS